MTMQVIMELNKKQVEISAQGPCEVFICYENTNTEGSSPEWIRQYELPQLNEFAKITNKFKKTMFAHMCGNINLIIEEIAQCEFQGIIDVTPPPTGDLDIANAVRLMNRNGKLLAGGIECNVFSSYSDDEFKYSVKHLLEEIPQKSAFMLGSGDAVPKGTRIEKLLVAKELLKCHATSFKER
ncbi:MAG: hypothetical protein HC906_04450 [Bacteroidales bacterium]|nr:hypothetical protein [Bacteroidales bacterium]